ncbi:hypothetical protein PQR75_46010 [Paraburkholderia fungorum]|uniref:hypothetical protein n=1 Tax=Paraburkholderia fungorum TaxID=134537 RepID=UPI0038BE195F
MALQRQVSPDFRTQSEIDAEARNARVSALLGQLEAEIDSMKALPDGDYRPGDMHELESQLRRLSDRVQVADSPFAK